MHFRYFAQKVVSRKFRNKIANNVLITKLWVYGRKYVVILNRIKLDKIKNYVPYLVHTSPDTKFVPTIFNRFTNWKIVYHG